MCFCAFVILIDDRYSRKLTTILSFFKIHKKARNLRALQGIIVHIALLFGEKANHKNAMRA